MLSEVYVCEKHHRREEHELSIWPSMYWVSDLILKKCLFAILMPALMLVGCASTQLVLVPDSSESEVSNYEYVIGPGDSLSIFVWGYEDLSITVPVRPDGKITTRLVEDMPASGKTPTELARDIESEYKLFVKNPTVSITVSNFIGSPSQQIKVVGGGSQPRTVPYRTGMTLLDLMIEVGGLSEFASGNRSVLVRNEKGGSKSYTVRLNDLLKKGDISANKPMLPGDILIIPESWF